MNKMSIKKEDFDKFVIFNQALIIYGMLFVVSLIIMSIYGVLLSSLMMYISYRIIESYTEKYKSLNMNIFKNIMHNPL